MVEAQQSRTAFFMHELPQSNYLNPAIQPVCKLFIGVPALTSIHINASNTGFSYNDFSKNFNSNNLAQLSSKLQRTNFATFELHLNIVAIGIKYNGYYFNFNIAEKINSQIFYPKLLAELAINGNDQFVGDTKSSRSLGASAYHLREYSLGIAQEVDWNYFWGLKGKLLFGKANLISRKSEFSLYTEETSYDLLANWMYQLNASFPLFAPEGDNININDIQVGEVDPIKYLFNRKNIGFALDFGFIYETDLLKWSGSVLDLGIIYWKSDVNSLKTDGSFAFEGVNVSDNFEPDEFLQMITDSISDQLIVSNEKKSYFTFLPTKLYLGATYELHPKLNAGILLRTEFYPRRPIASATLSLNTMQLKFLSTSISYSVMNGSYANIGLGIMLGKKNFMFHAITDNILAFFWPEKTHTANIRIGMNLLLGCNEKPKSFKYSGPGCYWLYN